MKISTKKKIMAKYSLSTHLPTLTEEVWTMEILNLKL